LTIKRISGKRGLAVSAVALLAAGLAACSSNTTSSPGGASASTGGSSASTTNQPALVMESSPEDSITDNFNPFDPTAQMQGMGATGLVYEPLYQFDLADPAQGPYPWLATAYKWGDGGKSITFTIRQGVKWNDGQAMTPDDVVFTFNYVKAHSSGTDNINSGGLNISSVSASGNDVTITFPTAQYMNLQKIGGQAILPKHVWSSVTTPSTYKVPKPVGTGPYVLGNFTSQGFTMTANPSYWQPVPVKSVFFPVYTSNTAAQTALFSQKIDWTGNFIPNLQKNFIDKDPAHNVAFEGANSSSALYPNLKTGPTAELAVRQAISAAINRQLMATEGESGLEDPVLNVSGITLPAFQKWLDPTLASQNLKAEGDPASAAQILQKAGYTKNSAGFFAKGGKELDVAITTPGDYSDYAADVQLAVQSLKQAGINATFNNVTVDAYNTAAQSGNFQLLLRWGAGGITPYQLYQGWLDPALIGTGSGNYERFSDPTITAALQKLNGDQTIEEQTADLAPIEKYVANNLPIIPATTSAQWCEYTSIHYTGWPTKDNPYQTCQPSGTNNGPGTGTNEYVLLHLKPAS
jgi:peptide/nickel transport system substrate-binding protein